MRYRVELYKMVHTSVVVEADDMDDAAVDACQRVDHGEGEWKVDEIVELGDAS